MAQQKKRFAAIMFTDMVGYSALAHKDEALAQALLEEHRSIIRPILAKHNGKEVKTTGDGFLVEFSRPVEAVRCAIEMQGSLQTHNSIAREDRQIHLRIGIHFGEIEEAEGDIYGDGVNIAARIESLADTGGICISDAVFSQVRNKINMPLVTIGKPELKNIDAPIEIYKVRLPTLEGDLPTEPPNKDQIPDSAKSIAVLPFINLSADPDNEYFSDGITEELIDALSQIEGLRVISRTSTFHYKGKDFDLKTVGQRLQVGHVLEGSVRKSGDKLRITAQLIRVNDDSHLWSQRFDREIGEIFEIQEEIAISIVSTLKSKLSQHEKLAMAKGPTADIAAYNSYLQGVFFWNKRTRDGFEKSAQYFREAIERDSSFALAHIGLADVYNLLGIYNFLPPGETYPIAKSHALKALELNSQLAEAHTSLAWTYFIFDWDWRNAEREFTKAIELNPQYATAHFWFAIYLAAMGRIDEALSEIQVAEDIDPLSLIIITAVGWILHFAGRYDQAIQQFEKAIELDHNFAEAHLRLGLTYEQQSMIASALEEFTKAVDLSGNSSISAAALAHCYAIAGQAGESRKILADLIEISQNEYVSAYDIAIIYVGLNKIDSAFEWLEKAYHQRSGWLVEELELDPRLRDLRSDQRFKDLLQKMNLANN